MSANDIQERYEAAMAAQRDHYRSESFLSRICGSFTPGKDSALRGTFTVSMPRDDFEREHGLLILTTADGKSYNVEPREVQMRESTGVWVRVATVAATLALALTLTTAHAAPAYPATLTPPPLGCTVTHWTPDDYSALAVCAGGYLVTKDDGASGAWDDIPYAIGETTIGPDSNGNYWTWPVYD